MNDFFSFRTMITPTLIRAIFILGLIFLLFTALLAPFQGNFFEGIAVSLMILIFGPLLLRVYCELMIVAFSIHECLQDIRKNSVAGGGPGAPPPSPPDGV